MMSPARGDDPCLCVPVPRGHFQRVPWACWQLPAAPHGKKVKLSKVISGCHFMDLHTGVPPLEFHGDGFILSLLQISRTMLDKTAGI